MITTAAVAHLSHHILIQQIFNVFILAQAEIHNQDLKSQLRAALQAGPARDAPENRTGKRNMNIEVFLLLPTPKILH